MTVVSVIVPLRNAQDFVVQALASLLCERGFPLEVVVVDDRSTDASVERVASIADDRIRLVQGPARGISACLNAGIAAARGAILMRCDADDLYEQGRIARQAAWLSQHPEYGAVCGAFSSVDSAGRLVARLVDRSKPQGEDVHAELRGGVVRTTLCTFAIRRAVFDRVGAFREYFETAEDLDFQFRLGEACQVRYLPYDDYRYRLHGSSTTHTQHAARRVFFEETARVFQAQRAADGIDDLMRGRSPQPPSEAPASASSASSQIGGMLVGQSWRDLHAGRRRLAIAGAWRALVVQPAAASAWRNLAKILVRAVYPR